MFAVVSKMHGCAKGHGDDWTFDPDLVRSFDFHHEAVFGLDHDWHRVETLASTIRKLTAMARTPRKPKQAAQASTLIEALAFVAVASKRTEIINEAAKHVRMHGNFAVTFDGIMSAGYPIPEELTLCPQIDHLTKALARSGKSLVLSETPAGRLSIKGEKLTALVPCLTVEQIPPAGPDPLLAPADDRIKTAFRACGILATEKADRLIEATLLLRSGDCTGTNGAAILQVWHGVDLPPDLVLPKAFCAAVAGVKQKLVGFGASWNNGPRASSVTFYFEGGMWLKTSCYADEWPATDGLWWQPNYMDTPPELFEAVDAVDDFNEKGTVVFVDGAVQSHVSPEIGAQYAIPGLQGGKAFAGKLMKQVAPYAARIDLTTYPDRIFVTGGEPETPVRGVVMCILENAYREPPKDPPHTDPYEGKDAAEVAAAYQADSADAGGWTQPVQHGGFGTDAGGGYAIDDDIPF